jgi:hypothetical protein
MVPETAAVFNQLTRLIGREDFINFSRRESFRSYINHGNGSRKKSEKIDLRYLWEMSESLL